MHRSTRQPRRSRPAAPPVIGAAAANEVIKALAYFFIALTPDGVPYIKIPNNLLSLLGIPAMGEGGDRIATAGGIGGSLLAGGGLYTAARIQLASSLAVPTGWPGMLIAPGDSAALASARAVVHPTPEGVGASGAVEQHPVGIKAVLADGILPEQVRSVLQHTVDAVLAPLSMLALAALASPGVVGPAASQRRGNVRRVSPSKGGVDAAGSGDSAVREGGPAGRRQIRWRSSPCTPARRLRPGRSHRRTRDVLETVA